MRLDNEFTVPVDVERAWAVMLDVERVAPCLPGAAIESFDGDRYEGAMAVKIGPITARYRGTVRIVEADVAARRAVMRAEAGEERGQGTAAATITMAMDEVAGGTRVRVETEMRMTGVAAQFGRGVMQDVSAKMMGRFAACLAEEIAQAPAAAAPAGTGLAPESGAAGSAAVRLPPGPAAAAVEAAVRAGAQAPGPPPVPRVRPTADVLDLGEVGRAAVLRRLVPVAVVVAALGAVLLALLRRPRARR